MELHVDLILVGIVLLGIAAQWLSWWIKIPAILPLLLIGLLLGPGTGLVNPDELVGDLLFPLVSLGVGVILFEGALQLRWHEIQGLGTVVRNLVSVGAITTCLVVGLSVRWLMGLELGLALLFGALVSVTGPTVIIPMLRSVRPKANLSRILRWEGIIIDPIGALLAVLIFEFLAAKDGGGSTLLFFARAVIVGLLCGAAGAFLLAAILRHRWMPEYLLNVGSLALVLGVFAGSNALGAESGLLAVTVMGMILANIRDINTEDLLDFKESLTVLLISVLFIVLAARLRPDEIRALGLPALGVLAVVLVVARPAAVLLSTIGSGLSWRERAFLSAISPRGIVAAAVASLLALELDERGFEQAWVLTPLTFLVILGTVLPQSLAARPLARWLGVSEPDPKGILIVGADPVARAVARSLADQGFRTLLTDTDWSNIRAARMQNLPTYYGNIVSEHADRHLDLVGIGRLFAMSPVAALNTLACLRYRYEFGANNVFAVKTPEEDAASKKRQVTQAYRARPLFGGRPLPEVAGRFADGHSIRTTTLTKTFGYADYHLEYDGQAIPLFLLDRQGRLVVLDGTGGEVRPDAGWTVVGLVPPNAATKS